MRVAILIAVAVLGVGCRARGSSPRQQSRTTRHPAETESRCQVSRQADESADCYAVRCAEDFIRRNGYTVEPASGPLRRDPFGLPLEQRHGLLYAAAIVHKWVPAGHFVGFRFRDSSDNVGRAVTMTDRFEDVKLDHLNFVWSPEYRLPHCGADAQ